ncbi:MAG: FmdE family protein [Thermosphaera sp.]
MVSYELLSMAEKIHGHVCPFLVLGLRASEIALSRLGLYKPGVYETINEEILAVVETNNCFADGVQVATGCTFGNNSLIYLDLGKNAVTLVKRGSRRGVRVYIDSDRIKKDIPVEARELFHRVVVERKGTREEAERLNKVWREIGLKMIDLPEGMFDVMEVEITEELERAPVFESVRCSKCGELAMSTRIVYVGDKPFCKSCANAGVNAVIGRGIAVNASLPYRILR